MTYRRIALLTLASGLLLCSACQKVAGEAQPDETKAQPTAAGSPASPGTTPPGEAPAAAGKVARVVFVDKEKACQCTKDRIAGSYKALTEVVGFPPVPDVVRIHLDTQAEKAAPYQKMRPVMVPPAIYLLDAQDNLIDQLQGEVTAEQIRQKLQ